MNHKLLVVPVVAAGLALSLPALAEEQLANTPKRMAQEAAKKSVDHLRWFIQRTRMIYGLSIYDFRKPE